jgi:hypothetical protein
MDANSSKIKGLLAFIKHPNTSDNERDTAQNILDNLCRKYGIDPSELTDEIQLVEYAFKVPKTEWEQQLALRLFWQISGKPANELSYRTRLINKKPKEYLLPFTTADYLQFCEAFAFYRKLYQKELKKVQDALYVAFIVQHNIQGISADEKKDEQPNEKMSLQEYEMLKSMLNSLSKDKFQFKKRIG